VIRDNREPCSSPCTTWHATEPSRIELLSRGVAMQFVLLLHASKNLADLDLKLGFSS
jgi:hypothetical protein